MRDDVHRPEAPDRIALIDLVTAPRWLSVKLGDAPKKKTPVRLDRAAFAVPDWLGNERVLQTA